MRSIWVGAALFVFTSIAQAGGFDPRHVAADARWFAHVDVEALVRSELYTSLHEHGIDAARELDFDHIESKFGVDVVEDLLSITFYGRGPTAADTVLVMPARPQIDAVFAALAAKGPHRKAIAGRQVVGLDDGSFIASLVPGVAGDGRTLVVAAGEAALEAALATLDGKTQSLARAPSKVLGARPSPNAIVFGCGTQTASLTAYFAFVIGTLREVIDLDEGETATIAARARSLVFEIGEQRGTLSVDFTFGCEGVRQAAEVGRALRAPLARLEESTAGTGASSRIERLARGFRFEPASKSFKASFRYGAAEFVGEVLEAEAALGIGLAKAR